MIKPTSSDKALAQVLIGLGVSFAVMLVLFRFLGELQGLIGIAIILLVQVSFLTSRVVALERELKISRKTDEPDKISEKTAS